MNLLQWIQRKLRNLWLFVKPGQTSQLPRTLGLRFDGTTHEELRRLMDKLEIRRPVEIFKKALGLLYMLVEHVSDGGTIILREKDGSESQFDPISFRVRDPDP